MSLSKPSSSGKRKRNDDDPIIDHRNQGKLKLFDQGNFYMCWVASAIAAVESLYAIQNPEEEFTPLSHQEMVNCFEHKYPNHVPDKKYPLEFDKHGFFGGWDFCAFRYVKDHGISLAVDCPWTGKKTACLKPTGTRRMWIDNYKIIRKERTKNFHATIKDILKCHPVSCSIMANDELEDLKKVSANKYINIFNLKRDC